MENGLIQFSYLPNVPHATKVCSNNNITLMIQNHD